MQSIKNYLDDFRESVSEEDWSSAVQKARLIKIVQVLKEGTDFKILLKDPNQARAIQVKLSEIEYAYSSDCRCEQDPCIHLLTATIIANTREKIDKLYDSEEHKSSSKISYIAHMSNRDEVVIEREIIFDNNPVILHSTLTEFIGSFTSGRRKGAPPLASKEDFNLDKYFINKNKLILSDSNLNLVHKDLLNLNQIFLESEDKKRTPIKFENNYKEKELFYSYEKGNLLINIKDVERKRFFLIDNKIFINQELPEVIKNSKKDILIIDINNLENFIETTLPEIYKKKLTFNKNKLPTFVKVGCKLSFEISVLDSGINVLPVISYGDPEIAIIKSGILIPNDWRLLPKRSYDLEQNIVKICSMNFGLAFNKSKVLTEEQIPIFYSRLKSLNISYDKKAEILEINPEIDNSKDFPEIIFSNKQENIKFNLLEISQFYYSDKKYFKKDNNWYKLPIDWLSQAANSLPKSENDLSLSTLKLFSYFDKSLNENHLKLWIDNNYKNIKHLNPCFEIMRPYQRYGSSWLLSLKSEGVPGALLADDMGLGKTLQAISIIKSKTLVICPTSLITQWKTEIEKFRKDLKVSIFHGQNRKIDNLNDELEVVITSYGVMKREIETFSSLAWDLVIVDEVQNIKNANSENFQKIINLNSKFKLSLTGTPVENSISDLISILNFTIPGLVNPNMSIEEIKKVSSSFILRRIKKEVLAELPLKTEVLVSCELSEDERNIYNDQLLKTKEIVNRIDNTDYKITSVHVLEQILRLRQISVDPRLAGYNTNTHSSKILKASELITNSINQDRKVLVFSQWTSALDLMESKLSEDLVRFERIDGSTTNRSQIVDNFQNSNSIDVLLLSLKAGGVGLNLTNASDVIFIDTWWNPAVESQAMDRVHRIGQKESVFIYKLFSEETIEEKVIDLQKHKLSIYDDIMSDSISRVSLEMKDLVDLLY